MKNIEFNNDRLWQILYLLLGANRVFEVFQYKFTQNNYPDKLHLLASIPEWMSEIKIGDTPPFLDEEVTQKTINAPPILSRSHNLHLDQFRYQSGANAQTPPDKKPLKEKPLEQPISQSRPARSKYLVLFVALIILTVPAVLSLGFLYSGIVNREQLPTTPIIFTFSPSITTITPTPFQPSTSITFTSSPPMVDPISDPLPDPIGFIYRYYNYINNRDYASAWSYLSVNYMDKMSNKVGHTFSYSNDYVSYWDTVAKIDILEVNLESINSQSAVLFFKLRWNMFDGSSLIYNHRFYLVRNSYTNSWLIDFVETWE